MKEEVEDERVVTTVDCVSKIAAVAVGRLSSNIGEG